MEVGRCRGMRRSRGQKFDELLLDGGKSAVAPEALRRIAEIYRLERDMKSA